MSGRQSKSSGRILGIAFAAGILSFLTGCNLTSSSAPSSGASSLPPAISPAAASPATATAPLGPVTTGSLQFIVNPTQVGNYAGWQLQITRADNIWGFKPFTSQRLNESNSLSVDLWPGRYLVQILLNGEAEKAYWVFIHAGAVSVITVDVGFFTNDIKLFDNMADQSHVHKYVLYKQPVGKMFDPLPVDMPGGFNGEYEGPRVGKEPVGHGPLFIYKEKELIATVPDAKAEEGRLIGEIKFKDGRTVNGQLDDNYSFPDGTTTTWPDGSHFEGRYQGPSPANGTLTLADGTVWTGPMQDKAPRGPGTVTHPDGSSIENVPGIDTAQYNGRFPCKDTAGKAGSCYYDKGQLLSESAYAQKKAEQEMRQKALAEAAAKEAEKNRSAGSSGSSAPSSPGANGCSSVAGVFEADQGRSRLTFSGGGQGHLWQHTYGGTTSYTFDIDFRYKGTPNNMRFDYGPGIYKDVSGKVVHRASIPGGDASCSYNGRTLSINGKAYVRR